MLLPEPMSRIVIVGSKARLDDAIETLYGLKLIHLIDHTVGTDEGFSIGAPRPYSEKASERLLSLKAMEKELDINIEAEIDDKAFADDVRSNISSDLVESIGEEVFKVLDRKNGIAQKIAEENARKNELSLIAGMPVDLDLYRGYGSVAVVVGSVKTDPTAALAGLMNSEFFITDDKKIMALFVKKSEKENAMRILTEFEFAEMSVPDGSGPIDENIKECDSKLASLNEELASAEREIAALKEKHGKNIITMDEEISFEARKGELPLRIATSEYSYVIDAWVPTGKVGTVVSAIEKELGNSAYVELQEDRTRNLHEEEHAEDRFKNTPTKMKNGPYAKHFEYPVQLVATPRYQEIDPSVIFSIFFPLFFGFMVGDIGYAIPFIVLGAYGLKTAKSQDFRAIAMILFFGGIWAFIFGFFFFSEMFGMHFAGIPEAGDKAITWQSLLGLHFPDWFTGMFPGHGHGISKVHEVTFLLKVSVYIGIVHMMLGYIVGFLNVRMQHGSREAFFEKGGWIMTFLGLVMLCYSLAEFMIFKNSLEGLIFYVLIIGAVLLIAGIAVSFTKEGAQAILELPGLFGNVLSYTRLTAIGLSKAGMALAFNFISIGLIGSMGGVLGIVLGLLMFCFLHLVVWVLAIISAGLHALRLQFVELMNKFFVGGGKEYEPLEIKRTNTKIVETEV